jgi:hypothetical protein
MMSEADECASDVETALANLRRGVQSRETMGVLAMYERAALRAGATALETDAILAEERLRTSDFKGA